MKEQIVQIMEKHIGKDNAITVQEIADLIGHHDSGLTNPSIRSKITECIIDDGIPIGSCSNGYFIIENETELNEYMINLQSRINGMQQRLNAIDTAFQNI